MKLFVIGATGRTGREIVQQALERGHYVTAFVRSPESISFTNERLTVLKGNVVDENQLFEAMQNHDAVPFGIRTAKSLQTNLASPRQRTCDYTRHEPCRSEAPARSFGSSAFSRDSQSNRQFYPAQSYA